MRGTPVWLASLSRQSTVIRGKPLSTSLWSQRTRDESAVLLRRLLGPAGNPNRERIFRMQITMCLHRAITAEEYQQTPDWFKTAQTTDLAGGPVEILYESEEGSLSTRPCLKPDKQPLDPRDPLLWLPLDCGQCETCQARKVAQDARDRLVGASPVYLSDQLQEVFSGP